MPIEVGEAIHHAQPLCRITLMCFMQFGGSVANPRMIGGAKKNKKKARLPPTASVPTDTEPEYPAPAMMMTT